jgi:acyl carrier protein
MNNEEIKEKVLKLLGEIAPEADLENIDPAISFREQIDIDSMDYLNFVIALDDEFGVEIPEIDYTKFMTLDSCVENLKSAINSSE